MTWRDLLALSDHLSRLALLVAVVLMIAYFPEMRTLVSETRAALADVRQAEADMHGARKKAVELQGRLLHLQSKALERHGE